MNIYESCPIAENEHFLLRPVKEKDCEDLLKVYSDLMAVPLFNGDNCNGDDFYYPTIERMRKAMKFWIWSYENGWFVRWSIVDKANGIVIGTVELCGSGRGILRIDLRSDYEKEAITTNILSLLIPAAFEWLGANNIITKAKPVATGRIKSLTKVGFLPMSEPVIGNDGTLYGDYYILSSI